MSKINHQNNFATNLTSNITSGATTSPINSVPSVGADFYIAFDASNINGKFEIVRVTSKTATNINHEATIYPHDTTEELRMVSPAVELDMLYQDIQGTLINGQILPSVSGNNLTVAIKTMAGNNPSVSDPVYCRIGNTTRSITSSLSVTKNAGTNWMNAGSTELATKEIDYFVYLGYNATDGVTIGFSRSSTANSYDDFSVTSTKEKYCAISTITNASATDYYENIGRFSATLSAGAGYTWSVPTFTAKNLIQRPIFETRVLVSSAQATGFSSVAENTLNYKIVGSSLHIVGPNEISGTSNATSFIFKIPLSSKYTKNGGGIVGVKDGGVNQSAYGHLDCSAGSNTINVGKTFYGGTWTASGLKAMFLNNTISFEI